MRARRGAARSFRPTPVTSGTWTLGLLFCLMAATAGLSRAGVFQAADQVLVARLHSETGVVMGSWGWRWRWSSGTGMALLRGGHLFNPLAGLMGEVEAVSVTHSLV